MLTALAMLGMALPLQARMLETEGYAQIRNGAVGQAREMAVQQAIRQALLQSAALVDSASMINGHELVVDSARVSAAGLVKDVVVLKEWSKEEIYYVKIRAQVVEEKMRVPSNAARYRKKVAVTQFQVLNRTHIADLPRVATELPFELLRRIENTGGILAVDGTQYLVDPEGPHAVEGVEVNLQQSVVRLAEALDVQFIIGGVIRDMGGSSAWFKKTRRLELDVTVYDGVSGTVISKRRINDAIEDLGLNATRQPPFASAEFLRTDYGRVVDAGLDKLARGVVADLSPLPFTARIVRASGNEIYFDAGASSLVRVGDVLMAYRQSDLPVDDGRPRRFMGSQETPLATLVVRKVQPLFSIGELEGDAIKLQPGDIVRFGW
ncbi:MAG: flagellar assembly protein T N-terminal domain-containing protein [Pseudomonadota bacterium]